MWQRTFHVILLLRGPLVPAIRLHLFLPNHLRLLTNLLPFVASVDAPMETDYPVQEGQERDTAPPLGQRGLD